MGGILHPIVAVIACRSRSRANERPVKLDDVVYYYAARRDEQIRKPQRATVLRVYPTGELSLSPYLDVVTEDGTVYKNVPPTEESNTGTDDGAGWEEIAA